MKPLPYHSANELPIAELRAVLAGRVDIAILFGSLAAGKTHRESDLDLAIWPKDATDLDLLACDLMSTLRTERLDLADLRRASGTLAQIVATRGRLLYEVTPGRFAEFAALAERRWQDDLYRLPDRIRALDLWLEHRGVR